MHDRREIHYCTDGRIDFRSFFYFSFFLFLIFLIFLTEGDGKERGRCQDFVVLFGLFFDVFPTEALMEVVVVRLPFATLFLPCFGFPDCVFVPPLGDDSASNLATTGKSAGKHCLCHMEQPLRGTLCALVTIRSLMKIVEGRPTRRDRKMNEERRKRE